MIANSALSLNLHPIGLSLQIKSQIGSFSECIIKCLIYINIFFCGGGFAFAIVVLVVVVLIADVLFVLVFLVVVITIVVNLPLGIIHHVSFKILTFCPSLQKDWMS